MTNGTSGHLADQESFGEPRRNISRIRYSSGDRESKNGGEESKDGDKDEEEGQGRGEKEQSEEEGNPDEGSDSPHHGETETGGSTSEESGDEATSPNREIGGEWPAKTQLDDMTDVGDMTYVCDDKLGGAPDPLDCEKLSWSGLRPPNSIETLQPGVPKFYSQGSFGLVP